MNQKKKTFKRDLSYEEKNGHHYRAAKRTQELKQQKREKNIIRSLRNDPRSIQDEYMAESWD